MTAKALIITLSGTTTGVVSATKMATKLAAKSAVKVRVSLPSMVSPFFTQVEKMKVLSVAVAMRVTSSPTS